MRHFSLLVPLVVVLALSTAGAQSNTLSVVSDGPAFIVPGGSLGVAILLDNDSNVQGWSFGICHEPNDFDIAGFADGSTTATVNNGGPPAFNNQQQLPNGIAVGVVIDLFGIFVLPPGTGAELLVIDYAAAPTLVQPPPGNPPGTTIIEACDTLGSPPVATVVVVGGASFVPNQNDLSVTIPPPEECDVDCVAGTTFVDVTWGDCNLGGPADYFMLFRNGILIAVFDDATQSYNDIDLAPGPYSYVVIGVTFPDPLLPPAILSGSCSAVVIPVTLISVSPEEGIYQGGTPLVITGTGFLAAPDTTVLIGGLTAVGIVVVDDSTIQCSTPAVDFVGPVDVEVINTFGDDLLTDAFLYGFIRGQASADTATDLGDGVFVLTYLFGNGPAPFCLDAADMNDSGFIDVADPIYLLTYLFRSTPEPPPPFTVPGLDPTGGDPYGCGTTPAT